MARKVMAALLIGSAVLVAGCNMVRGAGRDLESAANCTEDVMKEGRC